ncbi:unnamed protein product [Gongylonema pulchrum]|uniref:Beta-lactamase domain-containing protein n=1 Tax=Gongylonema pulchrum TaxID=637853 RepID=A0A183D7K7_9BILA|nr:unnamed protein product [Gongylonema pulchrum]
MLSREKEGLAVAAYKDDELVVDLWGGYAEKAAFRAWSRDTMTVVFSSTKAIGALIIAILVSRGHLHYEDKAGLISFDGELSIEQARDHQYVSRLIENENQTY